MTIWYWIWGEGKAYPQRFCRPVLMKCPVKSSKQLRASMRTLVKKKGATTGLLKTHLENCPELSLLLFTGLRFRLISQKCAEYSS